MTYVISDLHGYPVSKFKKLLEKANFGKDDFLYILGDVIDRNGDGGIGILQWIMHYPNIELILGNHEAMLLSCESVVNINGDTPLDDFEHEQLELLITYVLNGGDVTLRKLRKLSKLQQEEIFWYLHECPLYDAVTAGEKDFLLVHSGFDHFSPDKKLKDYSADDLLWAEPDNDTVYFDSIHTVFGHTPTKLFGKEHEGKIVKTPTWTCIDCGAGSGNEPVLLRLDDYAEFKLD